MNFKVFGASENQPSVDDLSEFLEEAEFEVTVEIVEEDEDEIWSEILVYEANYDEPVRILRQQDEDALADDVTELVKALDSDEKTEEIQAVLEVLQNTTAGYTIELPDDFDEEDNMLLLASLCSQLVAARADGIYSVDNEGFFDENGELLVELAHDE